MLISVTSSAIVEVRYIVRNLPTIHATIKQKHSTIWSCMLQLKKVLGICFAAFLICLAFWVCQELLQPQPFHILYLNFSAISWTGPFFPAVTMRQIGHTTLLTAVQLESHMQVTNNVIFFFFGSYAYTMKCFHLQNYQLWKMILLYQAEAMRFWSFLIWLYKWFSYFNSLTDLLTHHLCK